MYHIINSKFFEVVKPTTERGRLGHEITINAYPVMRIYPQDVIRGIIDFPVFV